MSRRRLIAGCLVVSAALASFGAAPGSFAVGHSAVGHSVAGRSAAGLSAASQHARSHYTDGHRCTIVGTPGNDTLVGTDKRDVICGLGGRDRIDGHGGNDVIAGGPGNDVISGGAGHDVIAGGSGADRLKGGAGDDRISGNGGPDQIDGNSGNDVQRGGNGADVLRGEAGDDDVTGERGDDDLGGGPGADDVDGGPGFNVCDTPSDPGDQQIRCAVDTQQPVVVGDVVPDQDTIDVSEDQGSFQVDAHVTDDTGVKSVQIGPAPATLVSGTARDGIWESTIVVPRYAAPGPRDLDVFVRDRVGRWMTATTTDAYTVVDANPDTAMPVLQSLSLDKTSVDVRTEAKSITATAHITDDLAGPTDLVLCPAHAFPGSPPSFRQAGSCVSMHRTSGTAKDSTWAGTLDIPKGAPSGTWNSEVWISDAAGNFDNDFWFGPDEWAEKSSAHEPRYREIPDGEGVFTVQGTDQDANPPVLTSLNLSSSTVDTSHGAVQVTADIAGTDLEGITGADLFIAGYPGYPDHPNWADNLVLASFLTFKLVSGTPQDGVWRTTFVVPGGTPDGSYFIQATLEDTSHWESWVSPDSGWQTNNHLLTPELAPGGTLFVVANS